MAIITYLLTKFLGKLIGQDAYGNQYYQDKKVRDNGKLRRWVIYKGIAEATKVPASWHAWLHYTTDEVPSHHINPYPWQKSHQRNLTGTKYAYKPQEGKALGTPSSRPDYEAWQP